jgi:hypothetical protein
MVLSCHHSRFNFCGFWAFKAQIFGHKSLFVVYVLVISLHLIPLAKFFLINPHPFPISLTYLDLSCTGTTEADVLGLSYLTNLKYLLLNNIDTLKNGNAVYELNKLNLTLIQTLWSSWKIQDPLISNDHTEINSVLIHNKFCNNSKGRDSTLCTINAGKRHFQTI